MIVLDRISIPESIVSRPFFGGGGILLNSKATGQRNKKAPRLTSSKNTLKVGNGLRASRPNPQKGMQAVASVKFKLWLYDHVKENDFDNSA